MPICSIKFFASAGKLYVKIRQGIIFVQAANCIVVSFVDFPAGFFGGAVAKVRPAPKRATGVCGASRA